MGAATAHSPTTARALGFVAEHRATAGSIGAAMAEDVQDPEAVAAALRAGLVALADPEYLDGQRRVAPGLGPIHGVRAPLLSALSRAFAAATRGDRPSTLLYVADRLLHERELEAHWFAFTLLERTLVDEPERTWQLLRRGARTAADWITVDNLAHPYATGISREPYRWSELEQLVFSPSRWERRLVGSTIANLTHGTRRQRVGPVLVERSLPILGQLMGDPEPDVQKALSWAYRSLADVDPRAVTDALRAEARLAGQMDDGHRAWVIRDSVSKVDPDVAADLREGLAGIRRRAGAPGTSTAAATAAAFGSLPDPTSHPSHHSRERTRARHQE